MSRLTIRDIDTGPRALPHTRLDPARPADVTLINMNLMLVNQGGKYDRQNYVPLGILSIAAYLAEHGYNVEFVDYQLYSHAHEFSVARFVDALGEPSPIVGISCMSNLLPFSILCAREVKKRYPACRIVLGGVGPSPVASEIRRDFPFVDTVVEGEGELPMLDLLRGGTDPLPRRQAVAELDTLPMPAYSLVDFARYDASPSIVSSRGCPYSCTFCTEPHNFGGRVRFRSVASVLDEIRLVHDRSGRELFLFQDDILPLNKERFRELMKGIRQMPFDMKWKCFSRVDLMDESLMEAMVESGCVQVRYGIESGSNKTLKTIRKGFDIETAFDVTARSVARFESVHVSFIWGYPFEEMPEFEETLRWVTRFEEAGATVLLFEYSPLPGSELFRRHREELSFDAANYSVYVVTGHEIVRPGEYGIQEPHSEIYRLIAEHPDIFPGFYSYKSAMGLRKKQRIEGFDGTRRTPVRSEHDI